MRARRSRSARRRGGFALVAVLLVLVALFALAAPFLSTVRSADASSARLADETRARLALDSAGRHARAVLSASHPAVDPTPTHDGLDELRVRTDLDPGFLDTRDPRGVMWDVVGEDLSGRIDPSSAPPQVFANLLGGVTRLAEPAAADDPRLAVASTAGLAPSGFAWVEGELVGWSRLAPGALEGVLRGLGADPEGNRPCGPRPPSGHALGAALIDQRAWAFARWRIAAEDGRFRPFPGVDALAAAGRSALDEELPEGALATLARTTSVHAAARAGARWMRAARLVAPAGDEPGLRPGAEGAGEGCVLQVDDGRWFRAGTTVRLQDSGGSELALVRTATGGTLRLADGLSRSYDAFETVVAPLAPVAVNVNTASPEVLRALVLNLELRGANGWITPSEADRLVALLRAERPFAGLEDFLRRAVLPAAGLEVPEEEAAPGLAARLLSDEQGVGGFLDRSDAVALYKNALNSNDAELAFGTMPFSFVTRDVHALELRAVVNAESGVERVTRVRQDVTLVVPQRDLLSVWTRQGEFDGATRLDGEGAGWTSGPENTLRHDGLETWGRPTEARAHLGPDDTAAPDPDEMRSAPKGLGEGARHHVFPEFSEAGYVQLAPARADEQDSDEALRAGRVLHFDDEESGPEGRLLSEEPIALDADAEPVGWLDDEGLLRPFAFEAWVQPRALAAGTRILDLGGPFEDSDRVSLLLEDDALVLRVIGPAGDHPATELEECGELRYPLGEGPGMPLDTWTHVSVDVRGDRPDQMTMLVDGRAVRPAPGRTRLTADLGPSDERIPVESTEGFPERCVLRIGRELVEARVADEEGFLARYVVDGELAGFGGRFAREIVFGYAPETNMGEVDKGGVHRDGEAVSLYGYSLPVAAHVPADSGRLASDLGAFAVARVVGVTVDGDERTGSAMEPVFLQLDQVNPVNIGWGMKGEESDVDGLVLGIADPGADEDEVLEAFSSEGGYAVLLGPFDADDFVTTDGDALASFEVIRYSGRDGNVLVLDGRGDQVGELSNLTGSDLLGRDAFAFDFNEDAVTISGGGGLAPDERIDLQTFVVPISVPANLRAGGTGFYDSPEGSDFLQLTRLGVDSSLTEWVRYDEIVPRHAVRDDPDALELLRRTAHPFGDVDFESIFENFDPGSGTGIGGRAGASLAGAAAPDPGSAAAAPGVEASQGTGAGSAPPTDPYLWRDTLGVPEDEDLPLTRSLASALRFRGVLGTFSHPHPRGTPVLPVWKALSSVEETAGWPGRLDAVVLFDGDPQLPGFPGVVQHAHRPFDTVVHEWTAGSGPLETAPGESTRVDEQGFDTNAIYVALQEPLGVPIVPELDADGLVVGPESRLDARLTLFPSGELPRGAVDLALGGRFDGGGDVPDALVDEAAFVLPVVDGGLGGEEGGTQLVLADPLLADEDGQLVLEDSLVRTPLGERPSSGSPLDELPSDAALLALDEEILCVRGAGRGGRLRLAGRGLLGTLPAPHAAGSPVSFLAPARVGVLAEAIGAEDAELPLTSTDGFPGQGLVLVEEELVHYTHFSGGALAMPRASEEPGARDGRGPGLFRGRFGTTPAAHAPDTPVILFPFRYPDRWAPRADTPELAYYGLSLDQPGAFWERVAWDVEEPAEGGPRLGVLQRSSPDAPWDGVPRDPDRGGALVELARLFDPEQGVTQGFRADRVEWRVHVVHDPGSFDARDGLSHAWKTTPRLRSFVVESFAPNLLLERVER